MERKRLFLISLLISIFIFFDVRLGMATGVVVKTEYGRVKGFIDHQTKTFAWLGIPYAKPPVGELRWRPPEDPEPWPGILKTEEFGNACAQVGGLYGPPATGEPFGLSILEYLNKPSGCEDCLTLNIWCPITWIKKSHFCHFLSLKKKEYLPVIVFIHGGSNRQSYAADPMWHGANLARKANAVVVTVNYRLGVFGWFAHPALRTGDPLNDSGNFGLLDIIKALKFVKRNIANFGGDPDNVTLMGQSAGALNVYSLMVSPLIEKEDLFHKAALFSGPGLNGAPLSMGETYANAVLRQLLIEDGVRPEEVASWITNHTNQEIVEYLRSKSTQKILEALINGKLTSPPYLIFADGHVVPDDSNKRVDEGNFRNVPVLIGSTLDEGKLFVSFLYKISDAERFKLMYEFDADNPSELKPEDILNIPYDFPSPPFPPGLTQIKNLEDFENFVRNAPWPYFIGTQSFTNLIDATAIRLRSQQEKVYAYRFEWKTQPEPWRTIYGAVHVLDMPFLFGNFQRQLFSCMFGKYNEPGRIALSDVMIASLAAFIRTGDPNNEKLRGVYWWPWSNERGGPKKLIFDADDKYLNLKIVYTTELPPIK